MFNHSQETLMVVSNVLAMQQALLFVWLGASIFLSNGHIIQSPVYHNIVAQNSVPIGIVQFALGIIYFSAVQFQCRAARIICAWIVVFAWFGFAGFYIAGSLHRIGAITCVVLACSQVYGDLCYSRAC